MGKIYGYVRVSTISQKEDRQIMIFNKMEIPDQNIYVDKMSGKDFNRPQYQKLLRKLKKGDLLIIKSIDRLGRNYSEILEQWRFITKEKGVDINVVDMPLLNTNTIKGTLLGLFISDLVLQILAYVAETERAFIKQRQEEGIAIAKMQGKHMGRPVKQLPDNFPLLVEKWERKEMELQKILEECNICEATFYRRLKEYRCLQKRNKK